MASQSERRQETRARLIAAARACFVEDGYDAAALDRIVVLAGVSKGALYHHFASKQDLFAAVFEAVSRETIARAGATRARTAFARLMVAACAWLEAVETPDARAIMLEEAPRALGARRAREIEDANAHAAMRAAVDAVVRAGEGACADPDLAARLLNATLAELALLRHASGGKTPGDKAMKAAVESVARGLLGVA
ncbi:MAG: helix-turn-helix domain-containing protein [Hyphomonadaceae bacterium]|nr:helix-turn-helix domain-containing protein [Hyphomonadaceae bacterium]